MATSVSLHPPPFEVTELREDARLQVVLRGELDLATAGVLADRLRRAQGRRETIVLDLDELAFIDAAGLRVVLTAAADARRDGWGFTVTRGSAPVRRLFALLDLDGHVPFDAAAP
jgi:anti-sigma B factor antagonist